MTKVFSILLLSLLFSGCSLFIPQYKEPEKYTSTVTDMGGGYQEPSVRVKCIDKGDVGMRFFGSWIPISHGQRVLDVNFYQQVSFRAGPYGGGFETYYKFDGEVTFYAKENSSYQVLGKVEDGTIKIWVIDWNTGEHVVSDLKDITGKKCTDLDTFLNS